MKQFVQQGSKNLDKIALKLKNLEFYFFGTNLVTMSDNFKAEKFKFFNFWFWQLTTCQTIVQGQQTTSGTLKLTAPALKQKNKIKTLLT